MSSHLAYGYTNLCQQNKQMQLCCPLFFSHQDITYFSAFLFLKPNGSGNTKSSGVTLESQLQLGVKVCLGDKLTEGIID